MCKKLICLLLFVLLLGLVGSVSGQVGKGNILFEYWFGYGGANISDLTGVADYPDNPDDGEWRTSFEGPVDTWDNYGERARGYLYPPQTGDYTFWIASDDAGDFWLSTNDDPANAVRIAWIDGWCPSRDWLNTGGGAPGGQQQSSPVSLVAGQKYYVEARMKEAGGGDNLAIAWGGPGIGAGPVLIAGSYLSPWITAEDYMAKNPDPPDGGTGVTAPMLMWTSGITAAWHDIYLGTDPAPPFKARQPKAWNMWFEMAGWVSGQTYYWRVDQVEADGTTIHTGDVWSFTAAPLTAYDPDPADGAKNVPTDKILSWSPGTTAFTHDVYFGTDETAVTNGTGGTFKGNQSELTYTPGVLANDTKYYWRIDEVEQNKTTKYPGAVWSFRCIPDIAISDPDLVGWWKFDEGSGTTAIDWSGHNNHGELRGGPQWVVGYDGGALDFDGINDVVYTGKSASALGIEGANPKTVTAWVYTHSFNNGGIWDVGNRANGEDYCLRTMTTNNQWRIQFWGSPPDWDLDFTYPTLNEWVHLALVYDGTTATAYGNGTYIDSFSPALNTSTANPFQIGCYGWPEAYFDGVIDDMRLFSKALTQAEIKDTMRGDPTLAWKPRPADGSAPDIERATPIIWTPGENAAKHDVYLATDEDDVIDADSSDTTGIYRGRIDPNSYTPPEGVEVNQTYYWRIDEYNTDATISEGRIWSFTVTDYLIIDDFEDYDDYCNRVFYTWPDGWGHNGDLACGVPPYGGNGTGSTVGYLQEPYAEQTVTHDGSFQSMPLEFLNDGSTGKARYSETQREFEFPQDFTRKGMKSLTLWFQGLPGSVGSFSYDAPTDIYTMTADGWDIEGTADGFHYAYKQLSGVGSIQAQVLSVQNTNTWAKAGVMIRETLDANSVHAMMVVTPGQGVSFQRRPLTGQATDNTTQAGIQAPHWVRISRSGNDFTAEHSADGSTWEAVGTENIPMAATVYIGLALTSHTTGATCEATFSDVTTTGTVTGQWQSQDIGIASNDAERLYVALEDSTGTVKDLPHPDPNAVQLNTWQEWNIDLADFAPVDITRVKKIYIGVGNRNAPALGGGGMLYIDDIRLYAGRCVPNLVKPVGDFSNNCAVDYPDLEIMTNNWLLSTYDVTPVAPSTTGLVSHYRLNGNANDSAGGNDGTEMGGPTYTAGVDGQAIQLDGVDDYVDCGADASLDITDAITMACWIKVAAFTRTWETIIAKGDNSYRMSRGPGTGDSIHFGCNGPSGGNLNANTTVTDDTWHHVALVYDGANKIIYIDGVEDAHVASTGSINVSTYNLYIGDNSQQTGRYLAGLIDDVRIYNVALSQAEVGSLAGKTAVYTQPLYLLLSPPDPAIDMNSDGTIDLKDYALLADIFLDEKLWP